MKNDSINLPLDIYAKYLRLIGGIEFTQREVDILACLVRGKSTRMIPSFLSIAGKTVASHISRIRLKTGCTSQESIIDFVESSDQALILKNQYYLSLYRQISFEKQLSKIPKRGSAQSLRCFIVYEKEQKDRCSFLHYLEDHLRLAGFRTEVKIKEGQRSVVDFINELEVQQNDHILYVIPQSSHALNATKQQYIFLLPDKTENLDKLENISYVDFSGTENYYFSVFQLLKKLRTDCDFDKIIEDFKKSCEEVPTPSARIEALPYLKKQEKTKDSFLSASRKQPFKIFLFVILILSFAGVTLFFTHWRSEKNTLASTESTFLNRPELMAQLDEKLRGTQGIQTVALVGVGGAGKTTLARQYAHSQNLSTIWEINAETKESLTNSFEKLAWSLASTEDDQKTLRGLQEIKDSIARESATIQFVKQHLKMLPSWFLIYDNVENFTDVQKYFPQNSHIWGRGKIILTTRNEHIQNNKYVNSIILIGELNPNQKFSLFTKIMGKEKTPFPEKAQQAEIGKFLEKIPSFPLDVSIAAYYLKATHVPYEDYLEYIKRYDKNFERIQKELLKESGDYAKTRYGIITLSLQHLLKAHKDFKDLLLFTSLLDSQNIPRVLLNGYKNNIIVDELIYNLRKVFTCYK